MRRVLVTMIGFYLAMVTAAAVNDSRAEETANGPGVVNTGVLPGLFINPTTGILPARSFTAQYCMFAFRPAEQTVATWNLIAMYGVTHWLEVGAVVSDLTYDNDDVAGGPFAVARVLKESESLPEVSAGVLFREDSADDQGNEPLQRRTVYAAASKGVWRGSGPLRTVRPTIGFRHVWNANEVTDTFVYGGADLELPLHLHLLGEVMNKPDGAKWTPYSIGVQLRQPGGAAFSLGYVQANGNLDKPGILVGIGIDWD